jgi:hypothetical protein
MNATAIAKFIPAAMDDAVCYVFIVMCVICFLPSCDVRTNSTPSSFLQVFAPMTVLSLATWWALPVSRHLLP